MSISPSHICHFMGRTGLALFLSLLGFGYSANAQLLQKDWDEVYGGNGWEECNAVAATNDGGYIMAGYTATDANGDVTGATYDQFPDPDRGDAWVVKTDDDGLLQWEFRYGGDRQDRFRAALQTADGGHLFGGWSRSNMGPQKSEACYGEHDYWIVKTDNVGVYQWDRTFGGDSLDYLQSMIQTSDGGFLLGGMSRSNAGVIKAEPRRGDFDIWVVKTAADGTLEWEKTIGGVEEERLNEIHELPDGTFVIGGSCESPVDWIDVTQPQIGGKDFWLLNLNPLDGTVNWEERYGGTDEDEIQAFIPSSDGGFLLVGGSRSPANPGWKTAPSLAIDIWALKIDAARQYQWDVTLGGNEFDNCYSAKENTVGHFILGGYSQSGISGTKTSPNRGAVGSEDFWLNYIAPDGTPLWDHAFGGSDADVMENMFQTSDGGYILAGHSRSTISGDKSKDTKGLNDFWIVKTLCDVTIDFNDTIVCPNTDVVLDATDDNCLACSWVWDDASTDSLRTININSGDTYSVTLTDGVGCSRSAGIMVGVQNVLPLDLPTTVEICADEVAPIGVANVPSSTYNWSNSVMASSQIVLQEDTYTLTVTDVNSCQTIDSVVLVVNPLPIVDIGMDTALCAGSSITFDAGNPGFNYSWIPASNNQTLTIAPNAAMSVGVQVTNPATSCAATHQLDITAVFALPEINNFSVDCTADNVGYQLSFNVPDSTGILINGLDGNWMNSNTYLDTLPSGSGYSFQLENAEGCTSVTEQGTHTCVCTSDAGQINSTEIAICGTEEFELPISNVILETNDVLEVIVHDGDANTIGNIIQTFNGITITYNAAFQWDQEYYVTALVGNNLGDGTVDQTDGCLSVSTGIPLTFHSLPNALIEPLSSLMLDCSNQSVVLSAALSSGTTALDYAWTGPTSLPNPSDQMIEVSDSGAYVLMVSDVFGCSALADVQVSLEEGLPVLLLAGMAPITCANPAVVISAVGSSRGSDYEWTWMGEGIEGSSAIEVTITEPGTYTLEIQNMLTDCKVPETFTIGTDTLAPDFSVDTEFYLDCQSDEAFLNLAIPNCTNCAITWTTDSGNFVNLSDPESPLVNAQGEYQFSIVDMDNGCVNEGLTTVVQNPDGPQSFAIDLANPDCVNDPNGEITVQSVDGGVAPYLYSINGSTPTLENQFDNLSPGSYNLAVTDSQGCTQEAQINVEAASEVIVELGDDITIALGEEVTLYPLFADALVEFNWTSLAPIACATCENPVVAPVEQTVFNLAALTEEGCLAEDRVTIFVQQKVPYYVPNAFSPNSDGNNDLFLPYFDDRGVEQLMNFQIFDRWGELIYGEAPAELHLLQGWDGKSNGKNMNPGVYVYQIQVQFKNGKEEIISGDVTLIR